MKVEASGKLTYWVRDGKNTMRSLKLTVCDRHDVSVIREAGVSELRRVRIKRLLVESLQQGVKLTHKDLSLILLTSLATIKRDLKALKLEEAYEGHSESNG